ncbi:hypothetical protein [Clostridium estertheticum]|uniref:hypothetical protein n=1 Tax=Clostridium estertheticum TaxID=238834 RepID=UPI001C0AE249|nr:hypothetical protein [Clostridium estertheticum]MBU3187207.1 hypothetical protein [Clostridium estertheticum]
MNKKDLIQYILKSDILKKWHWFSYHFKFYQIGLESLFAKSIVESCLECDKFIPGFSKDMIDNLSYLSGKEKYEPHYEQLFQRLAEILIINQVVNYKWINGVEFLWEPTTDLNNKNPELVVALKDMRIGIEVKSPSLLKHIRQRSLSKFQLTERNMGIKKWAVQSYKGDNLVFPRDNVIKDFLLSANEKFEGFKKNDKDFYGVLVIVWDDYIYEPITSLLGEFSGLFTVNSFFKNEKGEIIKFLNVDGVIIIRHIHQFMEAAAERSMFDNCKHALDYGRDGDFPPKAYIQNPYGNKLPSEVLKCLQADIPNITWGAEYMPQNGVFWI